MEFVRHFWVALTRLAVEASDRAHHEAPDLLHKGHWLTVGQWLTDVLRTLPGRHLNVVRIPDDEGHGGRAIPTDCWCGKETNHYEDGTEIKR